MAPEGETGLFVFGQAYAGSRDLDGGAGVSEAEIDQFGYFGGVGFDAGAFDVAVFVGRAESDQDIAGIAAENEGEGMFFGGRAAVQTGGFSAGASVIFDRSEIDTLRNPSVGGAASSQYDLDGTTIDAFVGYDFPLGGNLTAGPRVGVTRISIEREAATETGGGAFALQVDGGEYDATFLDADLRVSYDADSFDIWLAGGVRHQADGDPIVATARYTGTTAGYTIAGAERQETLGHAGAGLEVGLGSMVSAYMSGDVEFGDGGAKSVTGGVRVRF